MTNIKVVGDKATINNLNATAAGIHQNMPRWMREGVLYVQSKIPGYPAPPPGSTYRRTGTLGRVLTAFGGSFSGDAQPLSRVETFGDRVVGYVGGRLDYITYVVGDEDGGRQAWMHKGRWYRLIDIVKGNIDGVVRIFEDGIKGLIR